MHSDGIGNDLKLQRTVRKQYF